MSAVCSICKREDRTLIEQRHVEGLSLRGISKLHAGTTAWSLRRHFQHIPIIIEHQRELQVRQAENDRASCKLPGRVEVLIAELERVTANALRRKDYPSALRAIAARLQCLRTIGELSRELRPSGAEFVPGVVASAASVTLNLPTGVNVPTPEAAKKDPRGLNRLVREYYNLAPLPEDDEDGPVM